MLTRYALFSLFILMIAGWSAVAEDEFDPKAVYIYRGQEPSAETMVAGSWGSGAVTVNKDKKIIYTGPSSLKIVSQTYYSGARIDFPKGVTLFSNDEHSGKYLIFTLFFPDTNIINPAAGTSMQNDTEPYRLPKANHVRFVFESTTGVRVMLTQPTLPLDPDDNWMRLPVPVAKLKISGVGPDFVLKRLIITTESDTTFYLGQMKLVEDTSRIRVETLPSQIVAVADWVFFQSHVQVGVASVKYTWDFGDKTPVRSDMGSIGFHQYAEGGDFPVKLTVSDVDGVKTPVTVGTTITVIE